MNPRGPGRGGNRGNGGRSGWGGQGDGGRRGGQGGDSRGGQPQRGPGGKPPSGRGPAPFSPGKPGGKAAGNAAGKTFAKGPGGKSFAKGPAGKPYGKGPGGKPFQKGPPPSKPELGRLLALYGVKLSQPTLDQLWIYHQFLRENNKDLDLTRLIGFETMAQRHYADCMILHGFMQGRWPSPLVDVGSGAGFPGLMIKLMSPKTRIVLAEPRPRRVDFLERAIKELKLKDITVFPHKVTSRSLTEPMAGAITRAFETVEKTLPRLGGCLGVGGQAIFMKGPKVAEELTDLQSDEYRVVRNHVYRIPNTTLDRALLVMERIRIASAPAAGAPDEDDDMGEYEDTEPDMAAPDGDAPADAGED